jgi:hypothetical protein
MNKTLRFEFRPSVPIAEAEATLHLAMYAVEGLVGRVHVELDADFDIGKRVILIDESTFTGWLIARVFAGLIAREFGEGAYEVYRQASCALSGPNKTQEACA